MDIKNIKSESKIKGEVVMPDSGPSQEFLDVFDRLDTSVNGEVIEKAWRSYDTVGQQVVLEVS